MRYSCRRIRVKLLNLGHFMDLPAQQLWMTSCGWTVRVAFTGPLRSYRGHARYECRLDV